ncbi:MAG: DNA-3-methyladenine glycosylase 2 family protein [Saprospiraceae bacterium]
MPISKLKITRHLNKDAIMIPVIEKIPFPKLATTLVPLSEALVESIVYQQLSIKAAATIYKRLLAKFPDEKLDLLKLSRMKTETLRSVGLSYQKADYMRNIANFFLSAENQGIDWHSMPEDELLKRLTVIKGVGIWTVQMIMISPMGKLDVFPAQDLGVQQGIVRLYNLTETGKPLIKKMHEIAESWRPYRTIACMYLWRWKDQFRK